MTHEELDVITKSMIKRWLETYVVSDRDKWLAQRAGDTYSVQANQHVMEEVEDRLFAACNTHVAELGSQRDDLLAACEAAERLIEAYADSIDESCAASGCMCLMPGNTPHSQSIRDNELAQCRAAIARAREAR